jgi:uncharacterized protein
MSLSAVSVPPIPARSQMIDVLRGFALFGIIIVNAPFFAYPITAYPPMPGPADIAAALFTNAIAGGKFFLIFSFLFGFGLSAAFSRTVRHEYGHGPYFRRLLALLVLGLLHAIFLFFGDILMLYALLGVLLWFLRNTRTQWLFGLAGVAYAIAILTQATIITLTFAEAAKPLDPNTLMASGYLGGFFDAAQARLRDWPDAIAFIVLFNGPAALAMMLLGLALARLNRFPPQRRHLDKFATTAFVALLCGAMVSLAAVIALVPMMGQAQPVSTPRVAMAATCLSLAALPLSFGMAWLVLRMADRWPENMIIKSLATAGSSSLSGYILHSILLGGVFLGWGLGFFGTLHAGAILMIGIGAYIVIVLILNVWKRWFRYGPEEWLMRSFIDLHWKSIWIAKDINRPDNP